MPKRAAFVQAWFGRSRRSLQTSVANPKRERLSLSFATLFLAFSHAGFAQNFVVFDGAAFSINNNGDVTGIISDSQNRAHGFVRDKAGNTTIFDAPNSTGTYSLSINDHGWVTGYFTEEGTPSFSGFVRDQNGNLTVINGPSALGTFCYSINTDGYVTGWYNPPGGNRGFVLSPDGTLTSFDAPNTDYTLSFSINDGGDVVGVRYDVRGFIRYHDGHFTLLDSPFYPLAINNGGDVMGLTTGFEHGFLRDRNGNVTVFDPPNSTQTESRALNIRGDVAGWFFDASLEGKRRGFVRDRSGNIIVLDVPNSTYTAASGINDNGEITGYFGDASQGGTTRGFIRLNSAKIVVTAELSRDDSNNIVVQLTLANTGDVSANNVALTNVAVGGVAAPELPPPIDTISPGASAQVTVNIEDPVGPSGAASSLAVTGTLNGATFSSNLRVTLP